MITLEVPFCRLFFLNEISHEDGMVCFSQGLFHQHFQGTILQMVGLSSRMKNALRYIKFADIANPGFSEI